MSQVYVGREGEEPYSELELQRVSQVASLAALALQSSRRQLAREEALKLYEATNVRLQEWVDRLAVLLEGSRDFASSLDPDHLVELLEGQIRSGHSALSRARACSPSIPAIRTSVTTSSKVCSLASRTASTPAAAPKTWWPSSTRASTSSARRSSSSSRTRIRAGTGSLST